MSKQKKPVEPVRKNIRLDADAITIVENFHKEHFKHSKYGGSENRALNTLIKQHPNLLNRIETYRQEIATERKKLAAANNKIATFEGMLETLGYSKRRSKK